MLIISAHYLGWRRFFRLYAYNLCFFQLFKLEFWMWLILKCSKSISWIMEINSGKIKGTQQISIICYWFQMPKGKAPGSCSKSNQMFTCKRVGCWMSFKHKTHLYRHKKKCSAKSLVNANQPYVKENNFYQCKKCKKCYNHQFGVHRHLRTGCQQRKKQFFMCNFCQKSFQFKSILLRNKKIN